MGKVSKTDTFVANAVNFDSGGLHGVFEATAIVLLEEFFGRPLNSMVDALGGLSIGDVPAAVVGLGIPTNILPSAMFVCGTDLFKLVPNRAMRHQVINSAFGGREIIGKSFIDHNILERMLTPFLKNARMDDVRTSLLLPTYNMTKQRIEMFGKVNKNLFESSAMHTSFINGQTPVIAGIMAGTCMPAIFEAYEYDGSHYQDFATILAPGTVKREFDAMLKARHRMVRREATPRDLSRRAFWGAGAKRSEDAPVTLANARHALVHTFAFGTGDTSALRYDNAKQKRAGLQGVHDHNTYNTLQAMRDSRLSQDRLYIEETFNTVARDLIGRDAVTYLNRSLIPANDAERARFPSLNYADGSMEMGFRMQDFAVNYYVRDNLDNLAAMMQFLAATQRDRGMSWQGRSGADEYARISRLCETMVKQDPWEVLAPFMVHRNNAQVVMDKFHKAQRDYFAEPQQSAQRRFMDRLGVRKLRRLVAA